MSLKKYYDILGVAEGATKTEVKRAYRKLVMRFHPDRNSDPRASEIFNRIQEAYEVLYNGQTPIVDGPPSEPQTHGQARNRARQRAQDAKKAQQRRAQHIWKQHLIDELYYRKLTSGWRWLYFRIGATLGLILTVLTLLEFILPTHHVPDQFEAFSRRQFNGFRGGRVHLIQVKDHGKYWIEGGNYQMMERFPDCFVEKSWFLHTPKSILHPAHRDSFQYSIEFNMRAYFPFTLIIFLMPYIVMWRRKKSTTFSILYHFSFYLLIPLNLFYVLTDDRWAHILTMGFL